MPGLDGTGPMGRGPMTGGGFGRCFAPTPFWYGRGFHRFGGYGRGIRLRQRLCWHYPYGYQDWYFPYPPPEGMLTEREILEREAEFLKSRLAALEDAIAVMDKKNKSEQPEKTQEKA